MSLKDLMKFQVPTGQLLMLMPGLNTKGDDFHADFP